ncbi:hypothetical protein B0H13DRAFT_2313243 [Mycena leptocephala]|nr:hypothetical protein B0H13DRAFT_2313243 [Mycena leptocephala]
MTVAPIDAATTPLRTGAAQLAFELLFSATTAFLLTSALLPLFGLHVTALTVLRVTGICTLVVFALLDVLFGVFRRGNSPSPAVVPNDNPEFKLNPRIIRDAEAGCAGEKAGIRVL